MNGTSWHSFKINMGFEIAKNWQRYIYTTIKLPQVALGVKSNSHFAFLQVKPRQ